MGIEGAKNTKNTKARNMARAAPQGIHPIVRSAFGAKTADGSRLARAAN